MPTSCVLGCVCICNVSCTGYSMTLLASAAPHRCVSRCHAFHTPLLANAGIPGARPHRRHCTLPASLGGSQLLPDRRLGAAAAAAAKLPPATGGGVGTTQLLQQVLLIQGAIPGRGVQHAPLQPCGMPLRYRCALYPHCVLQEVTLSEDEDADEPERMLVGDLLSNMY